jgi:2-polyprenyl-6-methoxyphenol hydroxylase-like FAD-dependent oxidoreductase
VGLTLACDLVRRGVSYRLIDQERSYHTGRAAGLSPRTQEIFEDLGLLEQIAAHNVPLPWRFYDRDNQLVREIDPASAPLLATPDVPYPATLHVGQQDIETVLRSHLSSSEMHMELDCQLIDFIQHPDHVVAKVVRAGRSEAILARYLVGCDGGHSTVRKAAGIAFEGETRPDTYTLAGVIKVSGLAPTCRHLWRDLPDGFKLSLTPRIPDDTWNIVIGGRLDYAPTPSVETLQCLFDEYIGMSGVRLSDPTWVSVHQENKRLADRYRSGRVLLAGDAAHVGLFFGMQTGIQDAYNLGWKLALALYGMPDALLDTYQAERFPIAQQDLAAGGVEAGVKTVTTALLNQESSTEQKPAPAIPNAAILTQLDITYRGSRLSRDLDDTTGIRAGDRAPDAPCVHVASGGLVRIFDLFQGTHFTILAFGTQPMPSLPEECLGLLRAYTITRPGDMIISDPHTLINREGDAFRAYGVTGEALILVRPDGYVGLTGKRPGSQPISDYFHMVIGS